MGVPAKGMAIPLKIANIPVLLFPNTVRPTSMQIHFIPRPDDPYLITLDPFSVVPDEAVRVAAETFPDASAFMLLFSGSFLVVYGLEMEEEVEEVYYRVPVAFGGCAVSLVLRDTRRIGSEMEGVVGVTVQEYESPEVEVLKAGGGGFRFEAGCLTGICLGLGGLSKSTCQRS